jgi:predicted DNA-binding transcriptional regulator AlpA
MRALPTLADLAAHPERVTELAAEDARALLIQLMTLQGPLLAAAMAGASGAPSDRLLKVEDAAARLGQSNDWLYRHAATLPFTVRQGRGLRFSERRLEAYIATHANGRRA